MVMDMSKIRNAHLFQENAAPPAEFFHLEYQVPDADYRPPWDIGRVQPAVVQAEAEGLFRGTVLDAGAGLCFNAMYLASKGYKVTAVDFSPDAIRKAEAKAAQIPGLGSNLTLKTVDMLAPEKSLGEEQWQTVLDAALFHCFSDEHQDIYAAKLGNHVVKGGSVVLFAIASELNAPSMPVKMVSKDRLDTVFNEQKGWQITELTESKYNTIVHDEGYMKVWRMVAKKL